MTPINSVANNDREGSSLQELVEYIAKSLVDNPEAVQVRTVVGERSIMYELRVDSTDMGKVIGRKGKIAKAIRTVVKTAHSRSGKLIHLEIYE